MPAKGGIPWNKGLTKETNKIIKIMALNKVGTTQSAEGNTKRSETLKKFWKSPESEEARKKLSEKNAAMDYSIISKSQKKLYKTFEGKEIIRKRGLKRKPCSEETKRKISLAQKGRPKSLEHRLKISKTMQKLMNTGNYALPFSKPELEWGKQIERLFNIKLEHSFWLNEKCFDYRFKNYLFELDGSYWHSLPNVIENDKIKTQLAGISGFTLIRFANMDEIKHVIPNIEQNLTLLRSIFGVSDAKR